MLAEMTKITKVLDEKLDVLEAFELEARLRLSGVEEAVKTVERIAASRRIGRVEGAAKREAIPSPLSEVSAASTASTASTTAEDADEPDTAAAASAAATSAIIAAAATATAAATKANVETSKEDEEKLVSLLTSLNLLEKSLDVLYFLEFETVNEEAQIKKLINIANKIHSHAESKDRLVSQLVERRQSLEHLEKESNIIIAKTESLKKKIVGGGGMSVTTSSKEDEQSMRMLASQIEDSVNTLIGIEQGIDYLKAMEISTEEMAEKTEFMISKARRMADKKETTTVTPLEIIADDGIVKDNEKDGQKLKLLMVTLKEISHKISVMEIMEQDTTSMLSRTDLLERRVKDLEHLKLAEKKPPQETISIVPIQEDQLTSQMVDKNSKKQPAIAPEDVTRIQDSHQNLVNVKGKEEQDQLNLMTKVLKDIETKVILLEYMDRETQCMLTKAEHLEMRTRFLEDLKTKKLDAKNDKSLGKATMSNTTFSEQESARVSSMADVQKMKEDFLEKKNSSPEIEQMKEIVQDEIRQDQEVEEEIRMREMFHLKEKERQKELIKQIQLMEEIEEIQAEQDREQFYHEQEQEMQIREKEEEHERNREHNLELLHQTELMTQINLIQDTVMILDEVTEMDSEAEMTLQSSMREIEKHLDILDEVERGTAIAEAKIEQLATKVKTLSKAQSDKPLQVAQKLDKKLDMLEDIEVSTYDAISRTQDMSDKVRRVSERSMMGQVEGLSAKISTTEKESETQRIEKSEEKKVTRTELKQLKCTEMLDGKRHIQHVYSNIKNMGTTLDLLDAVHKSTELDLERSEKLLSKVGMVPAATESLCKSKAALPNPNDLLSMLSAIASRLVNIEDLQRDKNLQSDLVEKSIGKVRLLERQLLSKLDVSDSKTAVSSTSNIDKHELAIITNVSEQISSIEKKLVDLEKMHAEIVYLGSQAEVLGDFINHAKQVKVDKEMKPILLAKKMAVDEAASEKMIEFIQEKSVSPKEIIMPTVKEVFVSVQPQTKQLQIVDGYLQSICNELDKVNRCLNTLDDIETATALDIDRSEALLHKVRLLETSVSGKSDIKLADISQRSSVSKDKMPSDLFLCLANIEKRLLALENIQKEKGLQTDQIELSLIKLKNLEKHLSEKTKFDPSKMQVSDELTMPNVTVKQNLESFDDQSYIDDLFLVISTIEHKVFDLEKLYGDVQLLQSQAEVLKDNLQGLERKMTRQSMVSSNTVISEDETVPSATEKLEGKMENIAILEKEISDLLKESDMNSIGKKLDSMDEWEVVDKQSLQEEMGSSTQQCMNSADVAKRKIEKGLQRTYSQETTILIAKVDEMKESVEEQKALRMLERENSLEYLDYGGTGGPIEQEAALLLERVDQGFTQIITDQSETHLMTSLKKELTPDRFEADTSLAEHEREKMHQQQLIRQIQEMQDTASPHEQIEMVECIAVLDEEHKQEKEEPLKFQDQSQAIINIELMRKSVLKRQADIQIQMDEIMKALSLTQSFATSELMDVKESVDEREWVKEHQQVMDHQSAMRRQIGLMQQDINMIDVELKNIALKEERVFKNYSDDGAKSVGAINQQVNMLKPIDAMRKTISDMKASDQAVALKQLDFMSSCLDSIEQSICVECKQEIKMED